MQYADSAHLTAPPPPYAGMSVDSACKGRLSPGQYKAPLIFLTYLLTYSLTYVFTNLLSHSHLLQGCRNMEWVFKNLGF